VLAKEKKNVLPNMDFAYDFDGNMFVPTCSGGRLSVDAVSVMPLDELNVVLRGEPPEGLRDLLIERYGWG
jgi:hypothetical protein